jgi:hypothetical protein
MRIGPLRIIAGIAGASGIAAVWLVGETGSSGATAAAQTAVIAALVLFVAAIQHRRSRRLARKIDDFRRRVYGLLGNEEEIADVPAGGVPQEHFEQLARLLAANNQRLESAIDAVAARLDGQPRDDESAGQLTSVPAVGNATRTRL